MREKQEHETQQGALATDAARTLPVESEADFYLLQLC